MTQIEKIKHKGFQKLVAFLPDHAPAALAFSGGTDSAFLAFVASRVILHFSTYTFDTPYMNRTEIREAREFCEKYEISHTVISLPIPAGVLNNPRNRCYLCKLTLFTTFKKTAAHDRMQYFFDGTNMDDTQEYRPGRKALKELGIISPLLESGLTKEDIRNLSKELGLPTWDKPSNACLLTRLPYNHTITKEILERIEKAESYLHRLGFGNLRVRTHHNLARIEIPEKDFPMIIRNEIKDKILQKFRKLGFDFVTFDLQGFRSSSYDNL